MNPLGTRARAEELSRHLEGLAVAAVGGPMRADLLVAGRLRTAGVALAPMTAPGAEFRATLRTRLLAVAAVQAHNAPAASIAAPTKARALEAAVSWSQSRRAQRGMGVAAGAMASVVAVAGIAVAGTQSLPGDPFYGVKKGGEALQLRTAGNDVDKGSKHLDFAAERLSEVRALSLGRDAALGPVAPGEASAASAFGKSVSARLGETLAAMDAETRKGSALLIDAYRDSHDDAPLEILSRFAGQQGDELRDLLPELPAPVRTRGEQSLALVSGVGLETSQLLAIGVCTGACAPSAAAPQLPTGGNPVPQPAPTATTNAPCGCEPAATPEPTSAPSPTPTAAPASSNPTPQPTEPAAPSPTPSPTPSSSPTAFPVPVPTASLPVPLPTLPVPTPSLTPVPLVPGLSVPAATDPAALTTGPPALGG
jgi:hypothetical protein